MDTKPSEQIVDPTKPDLLGNISDKPSKITSFNSSSSEIEKGLLDMQLSDKFENEKNIQYD